MSEEIVKFKGTKSGVQLTVFAGDHSFEEIYQEIEHKLKAQANFFLRGTEVLLNKGVFSHAENERLQDLFREHELVCRLISPMTEKEKQEAKNTAEDAKPEERKNSSHDGFVKEMLVIDRTLRGGDEIRTESSVMVCGNVNPGAQIIAGGCIDIRGTCRGVVHAGAFGDNTAFIIADHLMPTQIRISNLIARSPDEVEKTERAERASIRNGQIVIEPIER